ncbi:MAG: 50S ribosomal protein L24 [Clostridia bacterium]|nr:50S ribosomal protein L24 [Clostridia bacterium]
MSNKVHVKTGDTVIVINGKDRGAKGKVLQVAPSEGKVIVEGVNIVTKHVKPKQMGEQGGLVKAESALYADKVQLVCPKCGKAVRVGHVIEEKGGKKTKMRVCKKCNAKF